MTKKRLCSEINAFKNSDPDNLAARRQRPYLYTFKEPMAGQYDKRGCRTGPPGWESILGLFKRFTNTGSVRQSPDYGVQILRGTPFCHFKHKIQFSKPVHRSLSRSLLTKTGLYASNRISVLSEFGLWAFFITAAYLQYSYVCKPTKKKLLHTRGYNFWKIILNF